MNQLHVIFHNNSISFQTCKIDNLLGQTLSDLRSKKDIAIESAAQGLQISVGEYKAIETGLKKPTVDELLDIANFFQIDVFDLIDEAMKKSKYANPINNESLRIEHPDKKAVSFAV